MHVIDRSYRFGFYLVKKSYLPGLPIISILTYLTQAKRIWIGYKNPCTWKKGMCKFKVDQCQENRSDYNIYPMYIWQVYLGKDIPTQHWFTLAFFNVAKFHHLLWGKNGLPTSTKGFLGEKSPKVAKFWSFKKIARFLP
jgi:hypothetical protein